MAFKTKDTETEIYFMNKNHTDIIKGLAIVLVVVSHIANVNGLPILIPLGGIGVALFLICSGYGLNESFKRKGLNNFLTNRFLSIMIPYWLIVCFNTLLNYNKFSIGEFVGALFLVYGVPLSWFVYYILLWYLIFYFSKKFLNDKNGMLMLLVTSLMFLFLFKDTTIGEQSFSFVFGVALSQLKNVKALFITKKNQLTALFFVIGLIFSCVFLLLKLKGFDSDSDYLLMNVTQLLMKLPLGVFIIQVTHIFKSFILRGLMTIGTMTYEVYLTHAQVLETIRNANFVDLIFFFIVTIGVSILVKQLSLKSTSVIARKSRVA